MSDLKNLFMPYELALILKEKEFNKPCFAIIYQDNNLMFGSPDWTEIMIENYSNDPDMPFIKSPLCQQVVDWLREIHGIEITQVPSIKLEKGFYQFNITRDKPHHEDLVSGKDYYEVYHKAIKESFKLIKK